MEQSQQQDVAEEVAAKNAIEDLVCTWAPSYQHTVNKGARQNEFVVTWGKPTASQPVPQAVVHATVTTQGIRPVSWVLERQSFIHMVGDGIAFQEAWLDSIIKTKLICKDVVADLKASTIHERR